MAPTPGPFGPTKSLAQGGDIRGPSTDAPSKGHYQWPTPPPAMAPTPGPFGPTKSLVQLDAPAPTGAGSYSAHSALHDVLHADRKLKIQSVAGPDVTDQIGASVHLSAMEGGDPLPGDNRHITGYATPANFVPQYGVSTTKDAADLADEERAKIAAKNAAKAAEKAALEAEVQAAREKETVKALAD